MKILYESYIKDIQHKKEKAAFGIVRGFVFFRNPSLHWAAEYTIWHKGDKFAKYTTMIWVSQPLLPPFFSISNV